MTKEEMLKQLGAIREHCKSMIPQDEPESVWSRDVEALDMAISTLRQQETVTSGEIALNTKTMTLDDAITHLDDTLSDTERKWSCESCRMEHAQLREWLAELRDIKRKCNEPLTLDELRQMDGEPVWVCFSEAIFREDGWFIIAETGKCEVILKGKASVYKSFEYYGKTWLAFRQKPEEGTV